ncbi:MAG: (d)CMP kinase [Candidatus Ancillula sp.]|jgi:cytidylate kinase|nr:(d)CMP kinase [Candidatus Ancillula sp.]
MIHEEKNRIIALDGPAGSGKSSTAQLLAQKLNYKLLDTGAYYRIATLYCMMNYIDLQIPSSVLSAVSHLVAPCEQVECIKSEHDGMHTEFEVSLDPNQRFVLLDGEDISSQIRTEAVTKCIHYISSNTDVRQMLIMLQQKIVQENANTGIVLEGRDTTDVVAPNASLKILLTASNYARSLRRAKQNGEDVDITSEAIANRDSIDANTTNFLDSSVKRNDVKVIDNSDLTLEETTQKILDLFVFDKH